MEVTQSLPTRQAVLLILGTLSSPVQAQESLAQRTANQLMADISSRCAVFSVRPNGITNLSRSTIIEFHDRLTADNHYQVPAGPLENPEAAERRMRELFPILFYRFPEDIRRLQSDFGLQNDGVLGRQTVHSVEITAQYLMTCIMGNSMQVRLQELERALTEVSGNMASIRQTLDLNTATDQQQSIPNRVAALSAELQQAQGLIQSLRDTLDTQQISIENEALRSRLSELMLRVIRLQAEIETLRAPGSEPIQPAPSTGTIMRG